MVPAQKEYHTLSCAKGQNLYWLAPHGVICVTCRFFAAGSPLVTEEAHFLSSPEPIPMRGDASRSQFENQSAHGETAMRQDNSIHIFHCLAYFVFGLVIGAMSFYIITTSSCVTPRAHIQLPNRIEESKQAISTRPVRRHPQWIKITSCVRCNGG